MKNTFSKSDIGASVVFAGFDGGSYSATIKAVAKGVVVIHYFPQYAQCHDAWVRRKDWARLTRFPVGCSFLAV